MYATGRWVLYKFSLKHLVSQDVGYNHGKTYFDGLLKAGLLPIFKPVQGKASHTHESCYTFTDLAQMVCKVARNQYVDESGECRDTGCSFDA